MYIIKKPKYWVVSVKVIDVDISDRSDLDHVTDQRPARGAESQWSGRGGGAQCAHGATNLRLPDSAAGLQHHHTRSGLLKHKKRGKRKLRDMNICYVIKIVKQSRKQ